MPTLSLHVHERIDPRSIIEAVRKRNGADPQLSLFATPEENPPIREAIEFYKHKHNWTNRLIAGDSLLVMNSLLEKEGLAGQVQMVYIDPPYGIKYRSNFQPFTNKLNVAASDKDDDLTAEPEMIRAFRDTWEFGIHSYLSYLRDRLLLACSLLHESGSCFVQISDENLGLVQNIMGEIFGPDNLMSVISFRTKIPLNAAHVPNISDYLVWYAKDKSKIKFKRLFRSREIGRNTPFTNVELRDGTDRKMTEEELSDPTSLPSGARAYRLTDLLASGYTESCHYEFEMDGEKYYPPGRNSWKTTPGGMMKLVSAGRIRCQGTIPNYVFYANDYPVMQITNQWADTQGATGKVYAVQTATKIVERCILMTTDPGDLILDPTCGSGTTANVSERWGRRWITCDTSRIAVALAKQRIMTTTYDYYELAHPEEGVSSGFNYRIIPHITLGSIANDEPAPQEVLYDDPVKNRTRVRVTGPFTVEAVPAPTVKPIDNIEETDGQPADEAVVRTGETQRQGDWRDELFKTGIRGKAGQRIEFSRLEPLAGTRWLQAEGETRPGDVDGGFGEEATARIPERAVISFGPDHAPMEQRQVALAIEEAQSLVPKPKIIVFAAFQFDPEAAKDIDETNWPGVTLLKAQMNADLLTEDLKKKRASNESFWLIGQPDVELEKITGGEDKGKFRLSVHGFDYYNTKTGGVESGGEDKIAMWMLDPDYDGRSLFPRQVFFPMARASEGWAKLARTLKVEIDDELIRAYRGTDSLPFEPGEHRRAAVKIIDDRGIESLKVIGLD